MTATLTFFLVGLAGSLLAVSAFIIGRKILLSSINVLRDGVVKRNSGFSGPAEDTPTNKLIGCFFLYVAMCWYFASAVGIFFAISAVVLSILKMLIV